MEYWQKQTIEKPLFEDILWSRPETKHGAGKLLVVGGNLHGFASVGEAYQTSTSAGIGTVRVLLPDSLRKTVGTVLNNTEFAPSTISGSFGKAALNELLIQSAWADGVLLSGDLGRNSETSILLESFIKKYDSQVTLTEDAIDYFIAQPGLVLNRPNTTLVLNLGQLQKIGTSLSFTTPFLLSMGLVLLVQALFEFTIKYPNVVIVTKELDNIVVAFNGKVSSTKIKKSEDVWQVETAAKSSVFWLQNPTRPFEAISSSMI